MADVVRIDDRLSRSPKKAPAERFVAKILLFTGVRYERRDGVEPTGKSSLSGTRPLTGGAKKR